MQRGARLVGVKPSEGVTPARVAGRRVQLLTGCTETGNFDVLVEATRELVELDGADAVVGGLGNEDSVVFRQLARRYPDVPFVLASSSLREATIADAPANLYRFEADDAQWTAGLGTYAYRDLGWRRAAVVADDYAWGWTQVEAFAAEFCALGGRIVQRVYASPFDPRTTNARAVHVARTDGVAVFVNSLATSNAFVRALARRVDTPAKRLLLSGWITVDPAFRADVAKAVDGAVAPIQGLPAASTPALRAFERDFKAAFPRGSGVSSYASLTRTFDVAVRAVVQAIDAVDGDLSNGRRRLRQALARTIVDLPAGRVRLDANRQAIVDAGLVRVTGGQLQMIRRIPNVDQTFGGLLPRTPASASPASCRRATPPPWAR
jgi:branched-chain amino acid transport system substrate-binding protein